MALDCFCEITAVGHCEFHSDQPVCANHRQTGCEECVAATDEYEQRAQAVADDHALAFKLASAGKPFYEATVRNNWGNRKYRDYATTIQAFCFREDYLDHGQGGTETKYHLATANGRKFVASGIDGRTAIVKHFAKSRRRGHQTTVELVPLDDADWRYIVIDALQDEKPDCVRQGFYVKFWRS